MFGKSSPCLLLRSVQLFRRLLVATIPASAPTEKLQTTCGRDQEWAAVEQCILSSGVVRQGIRRTPALRIFLRSADKTG